MSERMLMVLAIFLPRAYSARNVPPKHTDGDADQSSGGGDHQLPDKGVPQSASLDPCGSRIIEEKAYFEGPETIDDHIGQNVHEPEKTDRGSESAQ